MSVILPGNRDPMGPATLFEVSSDFTVGTDSRMGNPALSSAAKALGDCSLLLVKDSFEQIDELGLEGVFVEDEELGFGRLESAHVVFFGQMTLRSLSDYERPELVAVKPYNNDLGGVIHELQVSNYVNSLGPQRAFVPLGMWHDELGDFHLLTRYEHPVTTYDNIFWADPEEEPLALEPERVKKALRVCSFGVGLIHGLGVQQVDPQVKNLGVDNNKVRFIDLEEARPFIVGQVDDAEKAQVVRDAVDRDLSVFIDSCYRNPENIEVISEAMFDNATAMARSYQTGVERGMGEHRTTPYPAEAMPTISELETLMLKVANEATDLPLASC